MQTLKIIFKSLLKKKTASLLIIIQLTISLYMLTGVVIQFNSSNYQEKQFRAHIHMDMDRFVHLNVFNAENSSLFEKSYYELQAYMNGLQGVKGYGAYDLMNTQFQETASNAAFQNIRKELTKGTFKERYPNSAEILNVEHGAHKIAELNIEDGRGFTEKDFQATAQDPLPLLSGYAYKSVLPLGTELTDANTMQKYKIVGFLKKGSLWFSDSDYLRLPLISLDDKFVSPFSALDQDVIALMARSNKLFYEVEDSGRLQAIQELVNLKARSLNLRVESKTVAQELEEFKQDNRNEIYFITGVGAFLGLMTLFGLISVMLSSIALRKREFGIRIMAGATMNYIKLLIWGEIFVLTTLSSIISTIILYNEKHDNQQVYQGIVNEMNQVTIEVLLAAIGLTLALSFIASVIPIMRLRKLQPREMLGGTD